MVIGNESVAMQQFFLQTYCNGCVPTLIVGNAGVGKSSVSKWVIQNLPKDRYVNNIIHVTPATTSAFLQSAIMTGLDRSVIHWLFYLKKFKQIVADFGSKDEGKAFTGRLWVAGACCSSTTWLRVNRCTDTSARRWNCAATGSTTSPWSSAKRRLKSNLSTW